MSISIEVSAHVVAAGIFGDKARVTVVFTPVISAAATGMELEKWPEAIDGLLERKNGNVKTSLAELWIQPLQQGESWRKPPPFLATPQTLKLTRIGTTDDSTAIGDYWRKLMGKGNGFVHLAAALDPTDDVLDKMMRPSADKKELTPDIHGTARSRAAIEHSFERVRSFIGRLNKNPEPTRNPAVAAESLTAKIKTWDAMNPRPLLSNKGAPWTDARFAADEEDTEARKALEKSGLRADEFAKGRRTFNNLATSPAAAIKALTDALQQMAVRLASEAALVAGAKDKAGKTQDIQVSEASAAYRLASRTDKPLPDPTEVDAARSRLFTIQSNPSLARLFRFVVDFTCSTKQLEDALKNGGYFHPDEKGLDRDTSDKDLIDENVKLGEAVAQSACFMLLSLSKAFTGRSILTTAKGRLRGESEDLKGHFYPCTREEIDARAAMQTAEQFRNAAVAEQIDGLVDLGQKLAVGDKTESRYDVMTLDPVTATAAEYNRQYSRREIANSLDEHKDELPSNIRLELEALNQPENATHRGGGLALGDRWRQWHNVLRHVDSLNQRDAHLVAARTIVLDASDLTTGYKLDVGVRLKHDSVNRSRWHTLMHRYVKYAPADGATLAFAPSGLDEYLTGLYPDPLARREADDGQVQLPTAMREGADQQSKPIQIPESEPTNTTGFAEEVVGAWQGDPLGLSCGKEKHFLDGRALAMSMTYSLPSLPSAPALTPPALRFGWRYRFGLRAVFTGGVSMPLSRAFGHYERDYKGDLVKPNAITERGHAYRRHERIDAAAITVPDWLFGALKDDAVHTQVRLQGRYPVPQAGKMMVRSFDDSENRELAGVPKEAAKQAALPGIGFDRRILIAPAVSLEFATLHNAFREKKHSSDFDLNVKMCEPRQYDKDTPLDPNEKDNPEWVPVPVEGDQGKKGVQKWAEVKVYWRPSIIFSRPKGGLQRVDHRAAWGGFPVYRSGPSAGAVEPVKDALVLPPPAPVTDDGQILHRTKTGGFDIVAGNPPMKRTVLFSAMGVLKDEKGLVERTGAAVFRPLPTNRQQDTERVPFYPDPAATSLMVSVSVRGDPSDPVRTEIPLYNDKKLDGPAPSDYPDARPVVLDVVRGDRKKKPIAVEIETTYAALPHTPQAHKGPHTITVAHVTITLSPGEEAVIRCWCVPSITYLAYMSALTETLQQTAVLTAQSDEKGLNDVASTFAKGIETLIPTFKGKIQVASPAKNKPAISAASPESAKLTVGLGGLAAPGDKESLALAKEIRDMLIKGEHPEIAAVTEIEAVHAVDLPQADAEAPAGGNPYALLRATTEQIQLILGDRPTGPHKELYDPANWKLNNQIPGAVDVLIDGSLAVHGPSTGSIEIRALGAAAARGRFDDVDRGRSRDDQARGLWPKPDGVHPMKPKRLFGFDIKSDGSVAFDSEQVTLLRIEDFPPETTRIDLLKKQREVETLTLKSKTPTELDSPLRAQRPAAFPDARARFIKLFAVAISRHAGAMRTRYDELPEKLSRTATAKEVKDGKTTENQMTLAQFWLASTIRPARVVLKSTMPSFAWHDSTPITLNAAAAAETKLPLVYAKRSMQVRVRMKRPWFGTGEGERLGVVIWPPNLFSTSGKDVRNDRIKWPPVDRNEINLRKLPDDQSGLPYLQDADIGPGGQWVTRWGADPILSLGQVSGWLLSRDNFPKVATNAPADYFNGEPDKISPDGVVVENVLMPVPVDADAEPSTAASPPGGFMAVSLITYAPRFDPEQENWYIDLEINPCGAIYPFVRLGLVRYQPNAPRALQLSEPVVDWIRIMPERKLTATATRTTIDKEERVCIEATVEGAFSQPDPKAGDVRKSTERAPQMKFVLLRREPSLDGELLGPEAEYAATQCHTPSCTNGCMNWSASFSVPRADYGQKDRHWTVYAEEVDRHRPASYADEPRYMTKDDNNFASSGPRFTARLPLQHLEVSKA